MVFIIDWTNISASGIAAEVDSKVKPMKKAFIVSISCISVANFLRTAQFRLFESRSITGQD